MKLKTKNDLLKFMSTYYACYASKAWVKECKLKTAKAIYAACRNPQWILWLFEHVDTSLNEQENSKLLALYELRTGEWDKLQTRYYDNHEMRFVAYSKLVGRLFRDYNLKICKLLREFRPWSKIEEANDARFLLTYAR